MFKEAGFLVIQCQVQKRGGTLLGGQVCAFGKTLVNTNRAIHFTAFAKKTTQRKLQFNSFGLLLRNLNKRLDGLVRLFGHQEIEALEIRLW